MNTYDLKMLADTLDEGADDMERLLPIGLPHVCAGDLREAAKQLRGYAKTKEREKVIPLPDTRTFSEGPRTT